MFSILYVVSCLILPVLSPCVKFSYHLYFDKWHDWCWGNLSHLHIFMEMVHFNPRVNVPKQFIIWFLQRESGIHFLHCSFSFGNCGFHLFPYFRLSLISNVWSASLGAFSSSLAKNMNQIIFRNSSFVMSSPFSKKHYF